MRAQTSIHERWHGGDSEYRQRRLASLGAPVGSVAAKPAEAAPVQRSVALFIATGLSLAMALVAVNTWVTPTPLKPGPIVAATSTSDEKPTGPVARTATGTEGMDAGDLRSEPTAASTASTQATAPEGNRDGSRAVSDPTATATSDVPNGTDQAVPNSDDVGSEIGYVVQTPRFDAPVPLDSDDTSGFRRYTNARFDYALRVPRALQSQKTSNGAGARFTSPDGDVVLTVKGENNTSGDTASALHRQRINKVVKSGGEITYERLEGRATTVTGHLDDERSFYQVSWVGPGRKVTFHWVWPTARLDEVRPWIEECVVGEQIGSLDSSA